MANKFKVAKHPDNPRQYEVQHAADGSLAVGFAFHQERDAEAMCRVLEAGTVDAEYAPGEVP